MEEYLPRLGVSTSSCGNFGGGSELSITQLALNFSLTVPSLGWAVHCGVEFLSLTVRQRISKCEAFLDHLERGFGRVKLYNNKCDFAIQLFLCRINAYATPEEGPIYPQSSLDRRGRRAMEKLGIERLRDVTVRP